MQITYPGLSHANSRSQRILSYTYILHRYWKKKSVNIFFTVLTNIHKYKNINYSKILTAFEKMLITQTHCCPMAL